MERVVRTFSDVTRVPSTSARSRPIANLADFADAAGAGGGAALAGGSAVIADGA
jgi:hypothetical protein